MDFRGHRRPTGCSTRSITPKLPPRTHHVVATTQPVGRRSLSRRHRSLPAIIERCKKDKDALATQSATGQVACFYEIHLWRYGLAVVGKGEGCEPPARPAPVSTRKACTYVLNSATLFFSALPIEQSHWMIRRPRLAHGSLTKITL